MVATRLLTNSTTFTAALYKFSGRHLVSANTVLAPLNDYWVKTLTDDFVLSLPAISGLTQGDWIEIADAEYNAAANNITIAANGSDQISLYGSLSGSQVLDVSGARATLVVNGSIWSMLV